MNKLQSIVLGIMVVAICIVVFTAPKYVLVPGTSDRVPVRIYSDKSGYDSLKGQFGSTVEWDTIAYICIPILLIGGFFIIILKKVNIDEVEKIKRHLLKNWSNYLTLVILIVILAWVGMAMYSDWKISQHELSPEMQKYLREINK